MSPSKLEGIRQITIPRVRLSRIKSRGIAVFGHQVTPDGRHFLFLATPQTQTIVACEVDIEITADTQELFNQPGKIFTFRFNTEDLEDKSRKLVWVKWAASLIR